MKKGTLWLMLSWLIVATFVLVSCGPAVVRGEQEEEEEEEEEAEVEEAPTDISIPIHLVGEDVAIPYGVKGLAVELALESSDIGPGWTRTGIDIRSEGKWVDQGFRYLSYEGNIEFSQYAIEIVKVYPDIESALADHEFGGARHKVMSLGAQLEELLKKEVISDMQVEFLETQIEEKVLDLPFWDEAYRWNDIILRKDNIIVSFKCGRGIRRYDPLIEGYTCVEEYQLTSEQKKWLDREQWEVDDFLYGLAEKVHDKISNSTIAGDEENEATP